MKNKTVRELGGEIWAEISREKEILLSNNDDRLKDLDYQTLNITIDFIMSVLARHTETMIVNDKDLPVTPLPTR